jgi:hypothetical protein
MLIIGLADIHGNISILERMVDELAAADVVVLIGDITHFGRETEARAVVVALARLNSNILAVPGNCDYPEVGEYLAELEISLDGVGQVADGIGFAGVGGSLPCPGTTPGERSEEALLTGLEEGYNMLPAGMPTVLVVHQPPIDTTADYGFIGRHVGSQAIRTYIEQHQPLACLTGHIHEGVGVDRIGSTLVINPGQLRDGRYARIVITSAGGGTVDECRVIAI